MLTKVQIWEQQWAKLLKESGQEPSPTPSRARYLTRSQDELILSDWEDSAMEDLASGYDPTR